VDADDWANTQTIAVDSYIGKHAKAANSNGISTSLERSGNASEPTLFHDQRAMYNIKSLENFQRCARGRAFFILMK